MAWTINDALKGDTEPGHFPEDVMIDDNCPDCNMPGTGGMYCDDCRQGCRDYQTAHGTRVSSDEVGL